MKKLTKGRRVSVAAESFNPEDETNNTAQKVRFSLFGNYLLSNLLSLSVDQHPENGGTKESAQRSRETHSAVPMLGRVSIERMY